MSVRKNEHGQLIGMALPNWSGVQHPGHNEMAGRYARLSSLDPLTHTNDLFEAFGKDRVGKIWTYNFIGPFNTISSLRTWTDGASSVHAQPYFAVVNQETGTASGIASFMRIQPEHGVMEIGGITFAPSLQRTRVATEAIYLMMRRAMTELGYRRLEWKCDALNAPSRAAAERFGFSFEGVFQQAITYKGRNRDTAWYALLDSEWPPVERGFQAWLASDNFDESGQQRNKLSDLIAHERANFVEQEGVV
ncbi:GNAT family N-acetyltransferase [Ruegeria atlantica]|uniref:GNAT family N-acetyltransferase n=1 Tax=Ruegeria atlantica TaxID=81569 RepID=UPI00147D60FD|nr:GNAT family protein [Ruegeria atlantica]